MLVFLILILQVVRKLRDILADGAAQLDDISACQHDIPATPGALFVGQAVIPGHEAADIDALLLLGVQVFHAVRAAVQSALLGVQDLLLARLVGLRRRVLDVQAHHGQGFAEIGYWVERQRGEWR